MTNNTLTNERTTMSEGQITCRFCKDIYCNANRRKGCEEAGMNNGLNEAGADGASRLMIQLGNEADASGGSHSIMIVDDMKLIRKKLRDFVETNGYKVAGEADDGDVAVEMARELKPDLIIMDINMNRMCGIEATARIKRDNPDAKIVVLTSESRPSAVVQSLRAGASNFMPKSFNDEEMLRVIKNALPHQ